MNDEELYHQLRTSKPNLSFPADFQRKIWDRIATTPRENLIARLLSRWQNVIGLLARPVPAICLALAMGVGGGLLAAVLGQQQTRQLAEARYVKSVSPFEAAKALPR
jgi:hypothetical protein